MCHQINGNIFKNSDLPFFVLNEKVKRATIFHFKIYDCQWYKGLSAEILSRKKVTEH